jgi:hypothetical protein
MLCQYQSITNEQPQQMRGARMATATLKIEDLDFRLLRLNEVLKLIPVCQFRAHPASDSDLIRPSIPI